MNVEVEIKIRVDNLREIREKVSELGKLIKSIEQIDDYYIPCHRDFFANKPHPIEWLRIRTNPDRVIFEYDKSINIKEDGDQEYAEEYETNVSNPEELKKILAFLDFKKIVTVEKQREYWVCGNLEIALDDIKGLGYFVEVEAKGDFGSTAEARRECISFLKELGIKDVEGNYIKKGYPVLLLEENEKK
jgi:adenylate cyclase class 2